MSKPDHRIRATRMQMALLICNMKKNPHMCIEDEQFHSYEYFQFWKALGDALNDHSLDGRTKTVTQWQRTWYDAVINARRAKNKILEGKRQKPLDDEEINILLAVGDIEPITTHEIEQDDNEQSDK